MTMAFTHMALNPYIELNTDSQYFRLLGRYTVVLYNKASELDNVDVARMELFCHGNKSMEKIPPTKVPFCSIRSVQHIKLVFGAPVNCQIRKAFSRGLGLELGRQNSIMDSSTNCKQGICRTYKVWMQE